MATVEALNASVEALERALAYLVKERQSLRSSNAERPELEANRQAIIALQSQLGRLIGEQHAARSTS
jgi:hypothetical protein